MDEQSFDCLESLEPRNKGAKLYRRGHWVGTVWHSNFWGWQWTTIATGDNERHSGQCTSLESGLNWVKSSLGEQLL